ncbi:MAG: hypothetical protein M3Y23_05985, partial [Actinomycetota bacterium]|nr:hypothetical protein [Actinomycetota bacterium]
PGLVDRPVRDVPGLKKLDVTFDPPWPNPPVDPSLPRIPAYVSGSVQTPLTDRTPLAISLNGRIAGTLRSWQEGDLRRFAFTLPPEAFRDGINRVRLFEIAR